MLRILKKLSWLTPRGRFGQIQQITQLCITLSSVAHFITPSFFRQFCLHFNTKCLEFLTQLRLRFLT